MGVTIGSRSRFVVISITGEVADATAAQLRETLVMCADRNLYNIIIDMARATSLEAAGLGVLVGARKRITDHDGQLLLVGNARIERILTTTGLVEPFGVYQTVSDAVRAGVIVSDR